MRVSLFFAVLFLVASATYSQQTENTGIVLQQIVDTIKIERGCICTYLSQETYKTMLLGGSDDRGQFIYAQVNNRLEKLLLVKKTLATDSRDHKSEYENATLKIVLDVKYEKPNGYDSYTTKAALHIQSKANENELKVILQGSCAC